MRHECNELQCAADRQLSRLQWGEAQRRAVRNQLKKEEKPMKKKLSLSFALVMAAMLLAVGALAATGLMRTPEADAVTQARQALMDKYGLTVETLGIFHEDYVETDGGWQVTFRPTMDFDENMDEDIIGVYTVAKAADGLTASWSFDSVDPATYADGSLTAAVWGQEQLRKALHEGKDELRQLGQQSRGEAEANQLSAAEQAEAVDGASVWMTGTVEVSPEEGDMPMAQAKEIMRAAVQAELALTDEQAAQLGAAEDYDEAGVQMVQSADGLRMWEFQVDFDLDGTHYSGGVFIDAQTGEVVRVAYTVLGNG